ncbi:MAG: hypothetical protein ACXWC2_13500 [Ramlibacter sp.]
MKARPDARKAFALLLVLAGHALLLTIRLPQRTPRPDSRSGPPISVRLLAPAPSPAATSARRAAEPARHRVPAQAARPPGTITSEREPGTPPPAPDAGTGAADPGPATRASLPPMLDLPPPPPPPTLAERARARSGPVSQETPLQRGMARSARPDCQHAYAGLGLFAIPALLRDSLRDDGCRW